jgi:WD40 repeat protein
LVTEVVRIRHAAAGHVKAMVTHAGADQRWWVVSAGADTVCRWDVQAGPESVTVMRTGRDRVSAVAVAGSAGGEPVVVGLGIATMWRWQAATGQLLGEEPKVRPWPWPLWPTTPITAVDLGDRSLVVTGIGSHGLHGWDPATGAPVGDPWLGHTDVIWSVASAVLADGTPLVCSGGRDGYVRRWDARTGVEYGPPLQPRTRAQALAMASLPDGRTVVCIATSKGNVFRFDAGTGEFLGPKIPAGGPAADDESAADWRRHPRMACLATSDGGLLLTGLTIGNMHCWDLATGLHLAEFDPGCEVYGLAAARMADDTPVALVDNGSGSLYRLDPTGAQLGEPVMPHRFTAPEVWPVQLDRQRVVLAVPSDTGVRRFDPGTGQALGDPHRPTGLLVGYHGHAVAALPDRRTLLVVPHEDGITRLDLATGWPCEPGPDEEPGTVWSVACLPLPDGRVLIAGAGHHADVYRWDAATGQAIGDPLEGHPISVKTVTTTTCPDGTPMIISASEGGQILRWHAVTGERIGAALLADMGMAGDLTMLHHKDGRQVLVCVPSEGAIRQWDPVTGQPAGPTIRPEGGGYLIATDIDSAGVPTVFLLILDENHDTRRAEQWRLDTGTRVRELPANLRAVYRTDGVLTAVLAHADGTLTVTTLPDQEHR